MPRLHGHWVGDHWECQQLPDANRPYRDLPLTEVAKRLVEAIRALGQSWGDRSKATSEGCALWTEIVAREAAST
jgi:hypothetical protein